LSETHPIQRIFTVMTNEFPASGNGYSDVTLYWGAKDIEREGESFWDPEFIG